MIWLRQRVLCHLLLLRGSYDSCDERRESILAQFQLLAESVETKEEKTYSSALSFLIASSHSFSSHQGMTTILFLFKLGTKFFHSVTTTMWSFISLRAFSSISDWIVSRSALIESPMFVREREALRPVSRRTVTHSPLAMSLGPISRRRGTPCEDESDS